MIGRHVPELSGRLLQVASTVAQSQSHTSETVLQLLQTMALLLPVLAGLVQVILKTQSEREGYVSHAGLLGLTAASGGIVALLAATWRLTGYFGQTRYSSVVTDSILMTKFSLFAIGLSVLFVGLSKPAESLLRTGFRGLKDALPTAIEVGDETEVADERQSSDGNLPPVRVPVDEPRPLPTETIESPASEERTQNQSAEDVNTHEER